MTDLAASAPTVTDAHIVAGAPAAPVASTAPAAPARRGAWAAFTFWRRSRPFWGVVTLIAGAYFIVRPVVGATSMLLKLGIGGVSSYVSGLGMVAAALTCLFVPAQRHFPAIMAILLSLASLPLADLGGWVIGMLLGIFGAGMIFAWAPYSEAEIEKHNAKAARRASRRAASRNAKAHAA